MLKFLMIMWAWKHNYFENLKAFPSFTEFSHSGSGGKWDVERTSNVASPISLVNQKLDFLHRIAENSYIGTDASTVLDWNHEWVSHEGVNPNPRFI